MNAAPDNQTNGALLECRGVGKRFTVAGQDIAVLERVDLAVPRGAVTAITGRSGAGKSTLLTLLAGLDLPSAGSILFEGRPLESLPRRELALLRRRRIGVIFQRFNLLPAWSVFENVEAALVHDCPDAAARRKKVLPLLQELGLAARADNLPAQLSVGEQQRVAIARALVNEPALVLADEPTGELDAETAEEVRRLLLSAVQSRGATLIFATHGSVPSNFAARTLHLHNGVLS